MTAANWTVHVAGQPTSLVQRCAVCGVVLIDNTAWRISGRVAVHPPPHDDDPAGPVFWPVASRVAVSGNAGYLIEDHRAQLSEDEAACR